MKQDIAHEAANAAPPVVVTGWAWMNGLTLTDLVALATLAYVILQSCYLVWRWIREVRRGRK